MEEIRQMAARIRELREVCGCTAGEMARELGVSPEVYQAYEESGEDIPISVLYHIAQKFKVDMAEILTGKAPHLDALCVVKLGQAVPIDRYPGYRFFNLAHRFSGKIMQPLLVTVDPEDHDPALVSHTGQEFNYILDGEIELLFEQSRVLLTAGDCVYFNPARPHGQRAAAGRPATFLTVIAE